MFRNYRPERVHLKRPSQSGATLIEVIIALSLLALAVIGLVAGLSTGIRTNASVEERTIAINLARSQLENVKLQAYTEPPDYATITVPEGYTITVTGTTLTTNVLQKITTTVAFNDETVVELKGYKVNTSMP